MGFALKFREVNSRGSFVASGIGFRYKYDPDALVLDVLNTRSEKPLLYIDLDQQLAKNPLLYIQLLEKTLQIKSLMFSNNVTVDLSDSFDEARLAAILEMAARIARYSHDLSLANYRRFDAELCRNMSLKRIQVKPISNLDPNGTFYVAKLTTLNNNSVSTRSCTVFNALRALSDKVVRELITTEFSYPSQTSAHNLLLVSSKLATISRILDDSFIPEQYVAAVHQKRAQQRLTEETA